MTTKIHGDQRNRNYGELAPGEDLTIAIDTGGTFTDCVIRKGKTVIKTLKVPSNATAPETAILSALKTLDLSGAYDCRHGTTVGTNALLEKSGGNVLFITNRGFEDLLHLKRQDRPKLYALEPRFTNTLLTESLVIGCDVRRDFRGRLLSNQVDWRQFVQHHQRAFEAADAIAICFLHANINATDETCLSEAIKAQYPTKPISCSANISAMQREYERASTTLLNAYLQPLVSSYLGRLRHGVSSTADLSIMSSAGGLLPSEEMEHSPIQSVLSGPAGGYLAAQAAGSRCGFNRILSLDMGGTSTDVAVITPTLHVTRERTLDGLPIAVPMLPIETVGAGGGSIAHIDEGDILKVGPQSTGSNPGPACYGYQSGHKQWQPTVTDAHVVLGNIESLLGGSFDLVRTDAKAAISSLADALGEDLISTAQAIIETCNAKMARACRRASLEQGFDPRELTLVAFGGAGGLHACRLADALGMDYVVFPKRAGVLSADGISTAPKRKVDERVLNLAESDWYGQEFSKLLAGVEQDNRIEYFLCCRLSGQEHTLTIGFAQNSTPQSLRSAFTEQFEHRYGYRPDASHPLELVSLRSVTTTVRSTRETLAKVSDTGSLMGPHVIATYDATLVVPPGWCAQVYETGDFVCTRLTARRAIEASVALGLEIHRQRLMSIAEEMGDVLQKTALSTNIRERRDFSCAIFDSHAQMLAHAAHIPVHLGATPLSVQAIIGNCDMKRNTDYIVNDPFTGGTHLPDITVVRPIFLGGSADPFLYVVNRAHHADVGGITPGSLPVATQASHPNGLSIEDEGFRIGPQPLTNKVIDDLSSASRLPKERRIDLAAQVGANAAAENALADWIESLGAPEFAKMNSALLEYSEKLSASWIRAFPSGSYQGLDALENEGLNDAPLMINVCVRREGSKLIFDFRDTKSTSKSSLNAVEAITRSAVFYVVKLMNPRAPANDGLMLNIEIQTPKGTLVHALPPSAVSSGNVETSQRIVDVLLLALAKAFPEVIPAQSCGSMNNVLFGGLDKRLNPPRPFVHYETLGGGAGAGPSGSGLDGIHVHMTNTMNTPIEVLERRFPVRIRRYAIRPSRRDDESLYLGGRGVERQYEFLEPTTVTVITERQKQPPMGSSGGQNGLVGEISLLTAGGHSEPLPGKFTRTLNAGDLLTVCTAYGGSWGKRAST